ncbi:MAG: TonB-dependent receptor plug domain-containing protein [Desulfuromonadales bacterium]|nr:TonB-dependent receptor plug domain-containing protein [Desulfuromonadales bacterium]
MCHHYQKFFFTATFLLIFLLIFAHIPAVHAAAQQTLTESTAAAADEHLPVLPQVTVTGTRATPLSGSTTVDQDRIDNLPERDGTITDLLIVAPGVQFSEEHQNSFAAGEIRPAEISISGGRTYENNFLIDGMNNNNLIDPTSFRPTLVDNLPGYSQSIFLDTSLVDQVIVYDHNIPARYGGFTGGVVAAETKKPTADFGGRLYYRRTSDNWTSFHVAQEDKEDFLNSDFYIRQPNFTKQQTGFELNMPVTPKSALLAAYALSYSEIPLLNLSSREELTRRSDNYFLKYVNQLDTAQTLTVSALYAPYSESFFLRRTFNSEFNLDGDNQSLIVDYEKIGSFGTLNLNLSIRNSDKSREAPDQLLTWLSNIDDVPTSKDWGLLFNSNSSIEGGLGDLSTQQQIISLSADWLSSGVTLKRTRHIFNLGVAFDRLTAELERSHPAYAYSKAKAITDGTPCLEDDFTCIEGEQYLGRRKTYPVGRAEDVVFQYNLYLEDQISLERFTVRPGVRLSRDTLMENTDTAPRLAASYKVSAKLGTTLLAGWNRYYSQNLLTYKLKEALSPSFNDDRSSADEPFPEESMELDPPANRYSSLKTPYSDEASVGIVQRLFGGELKLDYVHRKNRDQLAKEYVSTAEAAYFTLNNNGSGEYDSYRASWTKEWLHQSLEINATYEETLSSNENYENLYDEDDLVEQIWYKGELLYKDEIPRENFNRPWTANLIYTNRINSRLSFTNTTRYQSHYRALEDSKEDTAEGYAIYVDVRQPSTLNFDWNLSYDIPLSNDQILGLDLDIFNVFNKKNQIGTEEDGYRLGRQVWLGIEYIF